MKVLAPISDGNDAVNKAYVDNALETSEYITYATTLAESAYATIGGENYPTFVNTTSYDKGDVVYDNGRLYRFTENFVPDETYFDEVTEPWSVVQEITRSAYEEVTYTELKHLVDNSKLIPGKKYAITDYSCIYIQPISDVEMEIECPDVQYIICTATSASTLSDDVHYVRYPEYSQIVECKYSIDPTVVPWTTGMTTLSPKGVVLYMKDSFANSCDYDFKHVKFRRWAVKDITPNTTPANATNTVQSPYRVYTESTAPALSDDRVRIGCGAYDDADIIEGVFSGKWMQATAETSAFWGTVTIDGETVPAEFSDEHVLLYVKPYKNTEYPWDKYIAFNTTMSLGNVSNTADASIVLGSMANIEVDPSDYRDRYTFDWLGQDASEMFDENMLSQKPKPLVQHANITNYYGNGDATGRLTNVCIMFGQRQMSLNETNGCYINNVDFQLASDCSILLIRTSRSISNDGGSMRNVSNSGGDFRNNLWIGGWFQNIQFNGYYKQNIIIGTLSNVASDSSWNRNVIFGHVLDLTTNGGLIQNNLWYNSHMYVIRNDGNEITPPDGSYSYNVEFSSFTMSNILSPFQYFKSSLHFNTNTFRAPYTKGVIIDSANQMNSYGFTRWGTHIGYGIGQGIRFNKLEKTEIRPSSFTAKYIVHDKADYYLQDIELFNDAQVAVPDINYATITGGGITDTATSTAQANSETISDLDDNLYATVYKNIVWDYTSGAWKVLYENAIASKTIASQTGEKSNNVVVNGNFEITGSQNIGKILSAAGNDDGTSATINIGRGTDWVLIKGYCINDLTFEIDSEAGSAKFDDSVTAATITQTSDITKKDVFSYDPAFTVESVANAPIVYFTWKEGRDTNKSHAGSIAQYWQDVVPECVHGEEGSFSVEYGTLGLLTSIVNAREILLLKQEIENIKQQLNK